MIDDAGKRLATSSLYRPVDGFRIFLCNSNWRLRFFAFGSNPGGGTAYLTQNIFIRASDIPSNTLIAPNGGVLLDQTDRPLSYFIAHEAAHVLLLRHYGDLRMLRSPLWLVEGYADLIAKAGKFDIMANRYMLREGNALLSAQAARHGLYRRYQLMVEMALRRQGATADTLFSNPPSENQIMRESGR